MNNVKEKFFNLLKEILETTRTTKYKYNLNKNVIDTGMKEKDIIELKEFDSCVTFSYIDRNNGHYPKSFNFYEILDNMVFALFFNRKYTEFTSLNEIDIDIELESFIMNDLKINQNEKEFDEMENKLKSVFRNSVFVILKEGEDLMFSPTLLRLSNWWENYETKY